MIGERGIAHIRQIVLSMGYMFYETGGVEAGIDGYIELRNDETGEVSNLILQVQGKATNRERLPNDTQDSFEWLCSTDDIEYWTHGTAPVLLIVVHLKTNCAYWKSMKDYFRDVHNVDNRRIIFDKKQDVFDQSAKARISEIVVNVRPGLITPPVRRAERLVLNLIPVEQFSSKVFLAETEHKNNKAFGEASRAIATNPPGEWIVKNGRVLSFHNLDNYPWNKLCDVGTIESFDTSEWASSDDPDMLRDFVQLLNRALKQMTFNDLKFDKQHRSYYFKRVRGKYRLSHSYYAFHKHTTRNVVKHYPKKKVSNGFAYCRHSAFVGRFQRFGDKWYLEVTPTYHFTSDGYNPDRFAEERLKKIKEIENNRAVLGQFMMWYDYLTCQSTRDMLGSEYAFLKFGKIQNYDTEYGVHDEIWKTKELSKRMPLFEQE